MNHLWNTRGTQRVWRAKGPQIFPDGKSPAQVRCFQTNNNLRYVCHYFWLKIVHFFLNWRKKMSKRSQVVSPGNSLMQASDNEFKKPTTTFQSAVDDLFNIHTKEVESKWYLILFCLKRKNLQIIKIKLVLFLYRFHSNLIMNSRQQCWDSVKRRTDV